MNKRLCCKGLLWAEHKEFCPEFEREDGATHCWKFTFAKNDNERQGVIVAAEQHYTIKRIRMVYMWAKKQHSGGEI